MTPREAIHKISDAMNASVIGQETVVERILVPLDPTQAASSRAG